MNQAKTKTKKTEPQLCRLNLNVPTQLFWRLHEAAKAESRTLTIVLARALQLYFDKHHPEPKE